MKKEIKIEAKTEKVPLLVVYQEKDRIKFRTTRDLGNFQLLGFLKTYVPMLEEELKQNLIESNKNKSKEDEFEF